MHSAIYLDHNSTTPVDQRVMETMLPYFSNHFGNAASRTHSFGWIAAEAVAIARAQVARLIGAEDQEIIFTSGSTEAINLGLRSVFENYFSKGNHFITVKTEHPAVLDTFKALEKKGAVVTYLQVDHSGHINLDELHQTIKEKTILICIMHANNETGLLHPIEKISEIAAEKNILFMTDATQSVGKINLHVSENKIALLAMSAHKLYGPKGTGALFIRRKNPRVNLSAQIEGGGHERGIRSGTLNVPGIVGFGKACEIALKEMWDDAAILSKLRTKLEQSLLDLGSVFINGDSRNRLPNTTNLAFDGIKADQLIVLLQNIALSTGSACASANPEPSHVLRAMGLSDSHALASVRFSLGKGNTMEEIDYVIKQVSDAVIKLRTEVN